MGATCAPSASRATTPPCRLAPPPNHQTRYRRRLVHSRSRFTGRRVTHVDWTGGVVAALPRPVIHPRAPQPCWPDNSPRLIFVIVGGRGLWWSSGYRAVVEVLEGTPVTEVTRRFGVARQMLEAHIARAVLGPTSTAVRSPSPAPSRWSGPCGSPDQRGQGPHASVQHPVGRRDRRSIAASRRARCPDQAESGQPLPPAPPRSTTSSPSAAT